MSVTALSIDYALAMAESIGSGGGVEDAELDALAPRFAAATERLFARTTSGELGFFDLPTQRSALEAVWRARAELHPGLRDVLVLGIGGSSLGARALIEALCPPQNLPQHLRPFRAGVPPRLHLPDNCDPWLLWHQLDALDPRTTGVLVVSKSGGTVETAAQMLIVRKWLEDSVGAVGLRARLVAITDPAVGTLRALCEHEGWASLPIPSNVGGRFSLLSAAGLMPAVLSGIDAEQLLDGAAAMAQRCRTAVLRDNPAGIIAALHYLHHRQKGRAIHVMMPYADRLRAFTAWYVQLWAESLGKRVDREGRTVESGPTPLPAMGATDQHAQVQLFMEGPRDKLITFISVANSDRDLTIPAASGPDGYLAGRSLGAVLDAELQGTVEALASDGRPSLRLTLERLDASGFGGLCFLYEAATAFAGELYGINAFDQPGVELGKRLAFGLLGRAGYEEAADDIRKRKALRPTHYRV
jgi:glucose-6-phosphate isomerase